MCPSCLFAVTIAVYAPVLLVVSLRYRYALAIAVARELRVSVEHHVGNPVDLCVDSSDAALDLCRRRSGGSCVLAQMLSPHITHYVVLQDNGETDVDCGGPCAPCAEGRACLYDADCDQSGSTIGGTVYKPGTTMVVCSASTNLCTDLRIGMQASIVLRMTLTLSVAEFEHILSLFRPTQAR